MIFFSYLTDFSYFLCEKKSESSRKLSEQHKNDLFERGFRWFQLFYSLTRITPFFTNIFPSTEILCFFKVKSAFLSTLIQQCYTIL